MQVSMLGTHKTAVIEKGFSTEVIYHETPVVQFNGEFIALNTGGWFTATTKRRMNQASVEFELGYEVFQREKKWFVSFKHRVYFYQEGLLLERHTGRAFVHASDLSLLEVGAI